MHLPREAGKEMAIPQRSFAPHYLRRLSNSAQTSFNTHVIITRSDALLALVDAPRVNAQERLVVRKR
jgi:hypothetical protein